MLFIHFLLLYSKQCALR